MSQTISVDDVGAVHGFLAEQTYTYDELNRLKSATEMNTPNSGSQSQGWKQTYSFDRFGNRRFDTTSGAYFYDGAGRRVKKQVGTEVTIFVFDAAGKLVAECATTTPSSRQTNYLTADTLGSPRINTDGSGAIVARHDYMPFGEEIVATAVRPSGVGYRTDEIKQKFTSYERDSESELDFAQAGYYSRIVGRFSSPDPLLLLRQKLFDPQQWDMYPYTRGNPLRFTSPSLE